MGQNWAKEGKMGEEEEEKEEEEEGSPAEAYFSWADSAGTLGRQRRIGNRE